MIFESRLHIWSHGTHDLTDCHQNTVMRLYSNIWFGHGREEWLTALGGNMEIITGLEQGAGQREMLRTNYWKRCRKCAHGICLPWDWITEPGFKPYQALLYSLHLKQKACWEFGIIWIKISSFKGRTFPFHVSCTADAKIGSMRTGGISLTFFYC